MHFRHILKDSDPRTDFSPGDIASWLLGEPVTLVGADLAKILLAKVI